MKTRSAKKKPRTHFEQVPVKVVKKIALERDRKKETTGTANVVAEPSTRKTDPYSMPISALSWTGH